MTTRRDLRNSGRQRQLPSESDDDWFQQFASGVERAQEIGSAVIVIPLIGLFGLLATAGVVNFLHALPELSGVFLRIASIFVGSLSVEVWILFPFVAGFIFLSLWLGTLWEERDEQRSARGRQILTAADAQRRANRHLPDAAPRPSKLRPRK